MNFIRKRWEEFWKTVDEFVPEDADVSCRSCYACAMCYQSGENVTWNGYEYENWDSGLKCDFSRRLLQEHDGSNSPFCLDARSKNGECGIEGKNFMPTSYRKSKHWFSRFGPWNFNSTRYVLSRTPTKTSKHFFSRFGFRSFSGTRFAMCGEYGWETKQ